MSGWIAFFQRSAPAKDNLLPRMRRRSKVAKTYLVDRKEAAAAVASDEGEATPSPPLLVPRRPPDRFDSEEGEAAAVTEDASDEGEATPSRPHPLVPQQPPLRIDSEEGEIEVTYDGSPFELNQHEELVEDQTDATASTMSSASERRGADLIAPLDAIAELPPAKSMTRFESNHADLYELLLDMTCRCDRCGPVPNIEESQGSGGAGSESFTEGCKTSGSPAAWHVPGCHSKFASEEDSEVSVASNPRFPDTPPSPLGGAGKMRSDIEEEQGSKGVCSESSTEGCAAKTDPPAVAAEETCKGPAEEPAGSGGRPAASHASGCYSKLALEEESEVSFAYDSLSTLPTSNPPLAKTRRIQSELPPRELKKRGGPLKKLFALKRVGPLRKLFVCDVVPLQACCDPPIMCIENGCAGSVDTDECSTLSGESPLLDDEGLRSWSFATQQWEEESAQCTCLPPVANALVWLLPDYRSCMNFRAGGGPGTEIYCGECCSRN